MRSLTSIVSMSCAFSSTGASRLAATEIGQGAGGLDRVDERGRLAGQLRHELDDLLGDVAQAHGEGLGLHVLRLRLVEPADLGLEVGRVARHAVQPDARQALEDERVIARAVLQGLQDPGGAAHGVEILPARVVRGRIALGEDRDHGAGQVVDVLHERDRLLPADVEGRDGPGKEDGVADRQDRQLVSEDDLLLGARGHGRVLLLGHGDLLGPRAGLTSGLCARIRYLRALRLFDGSAQLRHDASGMPAKGGPPPCFFSSSGRPDGAGTRPPGWRSRLWRPRRGDR